METSDLKELMEVPSFHITLDEFEREYLPVIKGEAKIAQLAKWLGNPNALFMKINVMNDAKEVEFWLPPVSVRPTVKVNNVQGYDTPADALSEARAKNNSLPGKGNSLQRAVLANSITDREMSEEDRLQWQGVLSRYGLAEAPEAKVDVKPVEKPMEFEDDDNEDDW